jgi:hypothetical protein
VQYIKIREIKLIFKIFLCIKIGMYKGPILKTNILNIGHNFSSIGYAGHNFYLLAQISHTIIQLAYFSDIAGRVRGATTGEQDNLSQILKNIYGSFMEVARRIKVELFDKVFKPPLLPFMRIRLKFA